MARINEDGNIFGRLSAVAVMVFAGVFVMRLQNGQCDLPRSKAESKSCCIFSADDEIRDAVADSIKAWRKK